MHRDVKPANLLVADDGTVKLTDFGISRAVGDVTVTATGLLAGTPAYLAPEVARGEDPLPGSDVFALGATLYTAVEGAPPFGEGDNPLAVLHAVALGEVSPPRNAGPLAPVLMSLLSVDVGARPTMREAARALADVAAGRAPRLPGPPGATKVLPSPGAEATAVLSGPAAASARPAQARPPQPRPQPAPPAPVAGPAAPPIAPVGGHGQQSAPAQREGSRRTTLLLAAVAAVAVLALAVVLLLTRQSGEGENLAGPSVPAGATSAAGTSSDTGGSATSDEEQTTTTAAPTTTTAAPAPADAAEFARDYYAMLPGDIAGAWAQLSPGYQAQTGGFGSYSSFWSSIRSVSVDAVTPNGPDRATVSLTYVKTDGTVAAENRWITVTREGDRTLISGSGL